MPRFVEFIGWGKYLPETIIDNRSLIARLTGQTSKPVTPEGILKATGIKTRRFAPEDMGTSDMATEAARLALEKAKIPATSLDYIIGATETPEESFPNMPSRVQEALGARNASTSELHNACSGSLDAFRIACSLIRSGDAETVLVVASEILSRVIDPKDYKTFTLFGDGAGAVILRGREPGLRDSLFRPEEMVTVMHSDGEKGDLLRLKNSGTSYTDGKKVIIEGCEYRPVPKIEMADPNAVYRFAVEKIPDAFMEVLYRKGWTPKMVDWLILHQANGRIISAIIDRLGIPPHKTYFEGIQDYGNTSAASLLIGLAEMADGLHGKRLRDGDRVVLAVAGANLTWGATAFVWPGERWFRPRLLPRW